MNRYSPILFFLFLVGFETSAQLTSVDVSAMGWHTSGDIVYKKTVVKMSPQNDVFWNYPGEADSTRGWTFQLTSESADFVHFEYQRYHLEVGYFVKPSSNQSLEVSVGGHHTKTDGVHDLSESDVTGRLLYKRQWSQKTRSQLEVQRAPGFERFQVKNEDFKKSRLFRLKPSLSHKLSEKWRTDLRGDYNWVEDGNLASLTDLQFLYGLSQDSLWLWLGFGGEYLTHRRPTGDYWSPRTFHSYGPRMEFSYLWMEKWSFNLSGNAFSLKENDFEQGSGYYLNTGISYGKRGHQIFKVYYEGIKSTQGSATWASDLIGLSFNLAH